MEYDTENKDDLLEDGNEYEDNDHLTAKQFFCVNLSRFLIEIVGTATFGIFFTAQKGDGAGIFFSLWIITMFGL